MSMSQFSEIVLVVVIESMLSFTALLVSREFGYAVSVCIVYSTLNSCMHNGLDYYVMRRRYSRLNIYKYLEIVGKAVAVALLNYQ